MSKPIFYTFGGSIWAAVPELAILELGYPPSAIDKKVVNLVKGENFHPSFLNINPNATLPTLSVGNNHITNSTDVTKWLIENAPSKPGKASGTDLIKKIHEDNIDPNFALLCARNADELKAKTAQGQVPIAFVQQRQESLERNSKLPEAAAHQDFYKSKLASNGFVKAIYEGHATPSDRATFFAQGNKHWAHIRDFVVFELPRYLPERGFIGGEKPGEDDFHLGAWLARIVATSNGQEIEVLEKQFLERVPVKVVSYFNAWRKRDSWKTVYADGLH